jgi:excisionase family DNA binding protein
MSRRLLTPEEAAERLVVSVRWVKEAAARGELVGIKLGRYWRFHDDDLEAWIEQKRRLGGSTNGRRF